MPKIGRIDIPDVLWKALVDDAADDFCQMAFDIAEQKLGPDSIKGLPQLKPEGSEIMPVDLQEHLVAIIRSQTGSHLNDDETIKNSKDYDEVIAASRLQGDQIAYNALSSDKQLAAIKNILESNWPKLTKLPRPS